MEQCEKDALLLYLDFHLMKLIEKYERHVVDPVITYEMYDDMYNLMADMEDAIDTTEMYRVAEAKNSSN